MRYAEEIFEKRRRKTREVKVGSVGIGGTHPIRIQSMTTSNTRDVQATVEQIMKLADVGCEIARVTVQGMREALACEEICSMLLQKGYTIPIVADIHFYPPAALKVVEFVDKVRINPGNFADKRALFIQKDYDEASYQRELLKVEETFAPLVEKCRVLKRALRIGTNHGSLSDRIMNRYGDNPRGMVESALEFARICHKMDYHDLVFSMKASNPIIMVQAYRLLAAEMFQLGWDYPFHLGVTEAGEGEDGRVKSAMGIGALLLDGIGDTIRVSLTEDPWCEIDPCRSLCRLASAEKRSPEPFVETVRSFTSIQKSSPEIPKGSSLHLDGSVIVQVKKGEWSDPGFEQKIEGEGTEKKRPDFLWLEGVEQGDISLLKNLKEKKIPLLSLEKTPFTTQIVLLEDADPGQSPSQVVWVRSLEEKNLEKLLHLSPQFFLFSSEFSLVHEGRRLFEFLRSRGIRTPMILFFSSLSSCREEVLISASAECGTLLIDGQFDGICLDVLGEMEEKSVLSFSIMQASRRRTTKTEFISCPGCGRTLFNLQEVSQRIRKRTSHLPGVRIAIMGCIVNGPGEMADADFGYVGSKPGKVDLYVGKKCVEKDVDFQEADDKLIALMKQEGKWSDPVSV